VLLSKGKHLIYHLFLLRAILEEQRGADGRKGTGNYIPVRSETGHRIRAVTGIEYFDSLGKMFAGIIYSSW
jgi:hypothetical protein